MLAGLKRRLLHATRYRGDAVECPCCGNRFSGFRTSGRVPNSVCLRCGSHARHRALALLLDQRPELLDGVTDLLHFAPEYALGARLKGLPGYVSVDYDMPGVDVQADITALPFEDASFDAFLCSHVLEHVEDDRAAMRELARILRPGGYGIAMVPRDVGRERTHEDATVTSPADREREFGQHDHMRAYGLDIGERLVEAGFSVEREQPSEALAPELAARYGLSPWDDVWLCTKSE